MPLPAEQRVDRLEEALLRLHEDVLLTSRAVRDLERQTDRLENEMLSFKNEMAEFKNEMLSFKGEMAEFKNRTDQFIERIEEYCRRADQERRDLNRKLGEIARAQGRLVEDIAAPSVPRVLAELLGLPEDSRPDYFAVRCSRAHPSERGRHVEVDVVAALRELLLVVEVKANLSSEVVAGFASRLPELKEYFPEHAERELVGAVASVFVAESVLAQAERLGLVVLAAGDDLLSIQNRPGFVPRRY